MKYREETVKIVDYRELDRIVKEYLKTDKEVSIVACMEWSNDSNYTLRLQKKPIEYSWDVKALGRVLSQKQPLSMSEYDVILQEMVNEDLIPEGEYLVEVRW